jgi:SPP1 family predicted phage head-tail adaptor
MQAGRLRNRITIQSLQSGQDEIGQPVTTWADVATVWADIRYLSGVESIKSDAEASIVKVSIRIRRRTDVTAAMRVVFGTTKFQIKAVLPDEQARERLDLSCEVVNG